MTRSFHRFACFLTASVLLGAAPAGALVYTYDNTTSGTLSNGATPCNNPLVRTFVVGDSFTVSTIALGLNLSHTSRGHIRGVLAAPNGATFQFLTESGDTDDNYDVLFSTNTEGVLDDNDIDPTGQPFYNRLVSVGGMNFFAGNAAGTWSLRLCDNVAGTDGTFNHARLVLTSAQAAAASCTGTVTYDWGANGNSAAFTSATVGDVTISQGATADFAGTASTDAFLTRTLTSGNHTGYYALTMDASAVGGTQDNEVVDLTSTFNLSRPVRDLSFSLLDVDATNNAWEDLVWVMGLDASGSPVPYTMTFGGAAAQVAGNAAEGDAAAGTTQTTGNVTYSFQGAVASLTINYNQSDNPASENVFMIVGISDFTFCAYDYGDAPASYGTSLAGGARHVMGSRNLYLGINPPDGEANGQPGAASTTDDTTAVGGVDDEDGVASFPAYTAGSTTYTVSVTANNRSTTQAATLRAYLDWNRDGDFNDAGEQSAAVNVPANTVNGAFNVTWSGVPANAGGITATYARFRISFTAAEVASPTGVATSGEVEDYQIPAGTLPVTLAAFEATETAGGLRIRWTTETETATVGYRVLALTGEGPVALNGKLVPSHLTDSLAPETYELEVPTRELPHGGVKAFYLVDFGTGGERTRHGPFLPGVLYGEESERHVIDWSGIAASLESSASPSSASPSSASGFLKFDAKPRGRGFPAAELRVVEEGLHRVTHAELLAAGLDFTGAPLARLGLTLGRTGAAVPLHVEGGAGAPATFGPGGFVEFRGVPASESLYSRQRVYRLAVLDGAALRPTAMAAPPQGAPLDDSTARVTVNRDRAYSFASPNGDPWYDDRVLANGGAASRDFFFTVEGLSRSEGTLEVELWGVTDWPGEAPDHHLQLELNGQRVVDERFDGLTARSYRLSLPPGLLVEGQNRLTVKLPGDTGYAFDLVHVDRYGASYPRRFTAAGERLTIRGARGHAQVDGFRSPQVVAWARDGRWRLFGFNVAPVKNGYRVGLQLPSGAAAQSVVDVAAVSALLRPAVAPARPLPEDLLQGPAEYLVISHPAFLDGLDRLVAERVGQGLSVKVVDVLDLYAAYTGGEVDPEAIRLYVAEAARRMDTRLVLLVGGDTYDYFDHLGIGSLSFLPTLYTPTDDLIRFAPADPLLGDLDRDGVPEIAVGRFPVRTTAELELLIDKTLAFPDTPAAALFAADGDAAREFANLSAGLLGAVPSAWPLSTAFVDDLGNAGARAALLGSWNAGPALVSFIGHSGPTVWSFQGLFSSGDADRLANVEAPSLVVQWGCWNTYHVSPAYDTLAHRLLLAGPQGAAAVVGSSTLSKSSSDALIGPEVIQRLFVPGRTVGEAMVEAKREVAAAGGDLRDVLAGWTLLGDPALVLEP